VFQNYALFPDLDVFDNVAFGLHRRRVAKDVLLLDEPLGALDAKIRKQLRMELKALQEEVGITFVFVTHDQEEALSMSDRVAVMNAGRIEQIGTPAAVYESPATVFVADFLGVSNLMDADADAVAWGQGECTVRVGDFSLRAGCGELTARGRVKVVARPERITLLEHGAQRENCLPGMIERTVYVGASLQVIVRLATGASVQASVTNTGETDVHTQGTPVAVHVPADALRVLARPSARRPTASRHRRCPLRRSAPDTDPDRDRVAPVP
jgi:spermidine/putrescine transport system ATP-binding protein